MDRYSILMLASKYQAISGHTRVIDSLSKELVKIGHKVTIGSFNFEKDTPEEISKLILHKSDITKTIKDGKFDILHNHQTLMNYNLLFTQQPLVFHYHGASTKSQKINLGICSVMCKKRINKIISISESAKKEIQQYFGTTPNSVIYNGVNTNFYTTNEERKFQKGNPQILFVGNLFEYKNVQFIIKSFSKLKQKFPDAHLQIVGDGKYKKNLAEIISNLNLQNQIELVGRVDDEQLREYYSSCDLYATASTWEFFNLPLLESMSCGKPVLISDLPVHQEIISKSQAGKTFSMNVDNFVKELEFILKNYARLSDNARKFALENDWSNMANRILDVYDELI